MLRRIHDTKKQLEYTPTDWFNFSFFSFSQEKKPVDKFNTEDAKKMLKKVAHEMQVEPWGQCSNPWL